MTENAPQQVRHVIVEGRVQGVGFRWFARERGRRMGLRGSVQNRPDGSVEIVVSGSGSVLQRFFTDLSVGPAGASVSRIVDVADGAAETDGSALPFPFAILK